MMRSRGRLVMAVGVTTSPPLGSRAIDSMMRSTSAAFLTGVGTNSTPSEEAIAWISGIRLAKVLVVGLIMNAARSTRGAISLSIATHLPVMLASISIKPVKFPPGRDKLATKPASIGSLTPTNTIGAVQFCPCNAVVLVVPCVTITSGSQRDQLFRAHLRLGATWRKANVDADIVSFRQSQPFEPLPEAPEARLNFWIVLGIANKHADAPQLFALLRTRDGRPRSRSAANKR